MGLGGLKVPNAQTTANLLEENKKPGPGSIRSRRGSMSLGSNPADKEDKILQQSFTNKGVQQKKQSEVKDEIEYAINWRRAFNDIYTKLKWLNAFAKINHIALQK